MRAPRQCPWNNQARWPKLFLSSALAGWSVGLKPIAEDRMEVWFGRLLLGQIDLATSNFIRADIRPNKTAKVRNPNESIMDKNVTLTDESVTHVLTQKCYRCPDCAQRTRHLSQVTRHFYYRSDVINGILKCV